MLEATAAEEGWTEATQIDVLIQYIENQNAPDAFADFLIGQKWVQDDDDPSPPDVVIAAIDHRIKCF